MSAAWGDSAATWGDTLTSWDGVSLGASHGGATWGDTIAAWGDAFSTWDGTDLSPDDDEVAAKLRARSIFVRVTEDRPFVRAQ